jgi:putative membrane protein
MWCFGEGFGSWSWFGGVGMIVFWVIFLALTVWLVFTLVKNNRNSSSSEALDIARQRYAKGEITKDEYDQYRNNL